MIFHRRQFRISIELVEQVSKVVECFTDFYVLEQFFIHICIDYHIGRAGRKGKAITYFTQDDKPRLRSIANILRNSGCKVPEYMLTLKKRSKKVRRALEKTVPNRQDIAIQNPKQIRMQKKTKGKFDKKAKKNGKPTTNGINGNATTPGQFVLLPKKRKATQPIDEKKKKKKKQKISE